MNNPFTPCTYITSFYITLSGFLLNTHKNLKEQTQKSDRWIIHIICHLVEIQIPNQIKNKVKLIELDWMEWITFSFLTVMA